MNVRPTTLVALGAVALCTVLALALQLWLLGALGSSGSNRDPELVLSAAANTTVESSGAVQGLRFDPLRGAAVAQAAGLTLNASSALALILHTQDVTGNLRLTLGWLTTSDLRRPATATAALAAHADARPVTLLLTGHPRWKETITRIVVALENTGATNAHATLTRAELLPANPAGGSRLLGDAWFASGSTVATPDESANRLLPLAFWLALICISSVAVVALIYRKRPESRAAALRVCSGVLAVAVLILTLLSNRWPGWTVSLGGGLAAALALVLLDRAITLPLSSWPRLMLAAVAAVIAAGLAPLVAAVAFVPAVMLLLGQLPSTSQRALWVRVAGLMALIPAFLLAAVAQGMIPPPSLLSPLIDPTQTLTAVAIRAGGLPGVALGLLAAHRLWPSPATSLRWSNAAVGASVWALTGAVAVLSIPKIAVLATDSSTYIAVFIPALACLALATFPKFQSIAHTVDETVIEPSKSESDLSAQALALLESHGERVQATLARREMGAAHSALAQMQRIASAAHLTALAQLRVALAENDLVSASTAAKQLEASTPLSVADHDALLELAHRTGEHSRVIALAADATQNEGNLRALALAHVLSNAPEKALRALRVWPDERTFAQEIVELHLLSDDLSAAQQALVHTGIGMTEPTGEAYVSRLGMRVQGPQQHADAINSIATWHPQLGPAQAAQGELLLRQGNVAGARARFLLAIKLDTAMWPLRYRVLRIDAESRNATSDAAPDHAFLNSLGA